MIRIDDTYFVDVDELIYTRKKKRIGKNKKGEEIETETTLGYYSSLQKALTAAMKYDTMIKLSDGEYTLKEAISVVNEVSDRFSRLLDEVIKDGSVRR